MFLYFNLLILNFDPSRDCMLWQNTKHYTSYIQDSYIPLAPANTCVSSRDECISANNLLYSLRYILFKQDDRYCTAWRSSYFPDYNFGIFHGRARRETSRPLICLEATVEPISGHIQKYHREISPHFIPQFLTLTC